tara:strand:- start:170 stop:1096 length:927 start_codon:yes stop_codon:yes gene_type:complete
MNKKINYGIVGAGYLGSYHAEQIQKIKDVSLVGIFDVIPSKAEIISKTFNTKVFNRGSDLFDCCDAISICTPATNHFESAKLALENDCHLFIEKPLSNTLAAAKKLTQIQASTKKTVQVGHIERFNPAFVEFFKSSPTPLFIESHRLSQYNVRGLDVPVVLDLMIHDIDLILSIVNSKISTVDASGASVVSSGIDLANARISFENNTVANLTASRISNKQLRQMRVFENKLYSVLDFQKQSFSRWAIEKNKNIQEAAFIKDPINTLYLELKSFVDCLKNNSKPLVGLCEATQALEVAIKIQETIEKKQ